MKHASQGDDETTRSGLFFEAIRVIKEMREHDRSIGRTGKSIRCRYAIYENVPGALSSPGGAHKGEDWRAVLTELVRVVEPEAPDVPMPDEGWAYADFLYGVGADGTPFSIAWRLTDAQYFGVAQRRARLCCLADYAGLTAPWILLDPEFERATEDGEPISADADSDERAGQVSAVGQGVSGDTDESESARERTPAGTESGVGEPGGCLNPWDIQSKHVMPEDGIAEALYSGECRYGGGESYTLKIRGGAERDSTGRKAGKGALVQTELSGTLGVSQDQTLIQTGINGDVAGMLDASYYKGCGERAGVEREVVAVDVYNQTIEGEIAPTVTAAVGGSNTSGPKVMAAGFKFGNSAQARTIGYEEEISPTLQGGEGGNQKPVVLEVGQESKTFGIDQQGGKGNASYTEDVAPTILSDSHGTPHGVAYGICSYESNAFKSSNPHSAIYKADTARTLDNNGGNPSCNQGGIAVVEAIPIEGNGARPSHYGAGYGQPGDPSFTLNHVEQHGVVATYDARGNGDGQTTCTLTGDHQDRVTDYTALVVEKNETESAV